MLISINVNMPHVVLFSFATTQIDRPKIAGIKTEEFNKFPFQILWIHLIVSFTKSGIPLESSKFIYITRAGITIRDFTFPTNKSEKNKSFLKWTQKSRFKNPNRFIRNLFSKESIISVKMFARHQNVLSTLWRQKITEAWPTCASENSAQKSVSVLSSERLFRRQDASSLPAGQGGPPVPLGLPPPGEVAHQVQKVLQRLQGAWREEKGRRHDGVNT